MNKYWPQLPRRLQIQTGKRKEYKKIIAIIPLINRNHYSLGPLDRIDQLLAGVAFDIQNKTVIKATAILNLWLLKENSIEMPDGKLVDEVAMNWEQAFIDDVIKGEGSNPPEGLILDGLAERRYVSKNLYLSWFFK